MVSKIYEIWDCNWYKINLIIEIKTIKENELIILLPQEYSLGDVTLLDYLEIDQLLSLYNKKLKIYLGAEFERVFIEPFKNITLYYWDSIDWYSKSVDFFTGTDGGKKGVELCESLKGYIPKKHFTTMVSLKNGREWRIYIINQLYKNNLQNDGNYSFRVDKNLYNFIKNERQNDIWMYENPIDGTGLNIFKIDSWNLNDKRIENEKSILNDEIQQLCCPVEHFECAFYLGIETLYNYFFVTEKTTRAIDTKKPFFIFSCVDFHKKLSQNYGFKLYHELIDYSFDSIKNSTDRFDTQINELVKMKFKYTPQEIYFLTKDNVEYNYNLLKSMRNKKNVPNIPDELYNIKVNKEYKKFYE
jgi:hypothetical protein